MLENVVSLFDVMSDVDSAEMHSSEMEKKSPRDALIEVLNEKGRVDMQLLEQKTGLDVDELANALEGVIFQDPFEMARKCRNGFNKYEGWSDSATYLSGNVVLKLTMAETFNEVYPGKFQSNIMALKSIIPEGVTESEVHISLGAAWIPKEEYKEFADDFFAFSKGVRVEAYEKLQTIKLIPNPKEAKASVKNTVTYGVRGEEGKDGYTKQYFTGIQLLEHMINGKPIKCMDLTPSSKNGQWSYEAVFNREKTEEASQKAAALDKAFSEWAHENEKRLCKLTQYYNSFFVRYAAQSYDGSFLCFPDLNPDVHLYKHQKNAIAKVLLSKSNMLLAHDVGSGKTFEIIVICHELKRLNMSNKNLVVAPNNVLLATAETHRHLYPKDKILVITPKDFAPKKRLDSLNLIKTGDYVAIYMAYSSFDMIEMSNHYYLQKIEQEIRSLKDALLKANSVGEKNALESKIKSWTKKRRKYESGVDTPWPTFDQLDIETLVIDEAHNYKNIPIKSKHIDIIGLSTGSKKCEKAFEKGHYVNQLILATGTPITNSMVDLFTFQSYLQPEVLRLFGIENFDRWVNTFGSKETLIECDVDANSKNLRQRIRFSSFQNIPELMNMFSQVCDFYHMQKPLPGVDFPRFNGPITVQVPRLQEQAAYIDLLSERVDAVRNKSVSRKDDNLLKIVIDGRKAALDLRLVEEDAYLNILKKTKIDICAEITMDISKKYPDSAQIVFSDIGVPKKTFNVYDAFKEKLIQLGMEKDRIAFIHDATTATEQTQLFEAINKGKISVVIGSTQKLGVGVNVQERMVACHHLSVPWRPADMVQREGRILRCGNTSDEVFIYRYATEGTFDSYLWQILEDKQRFISSFLAGVYAGREAEDIGDTELDYGEVKALCIGNPLIRERVQQANEIGRLQIRLRNRRKEIEKLKNLIDSLSKKKKECIDLSEHIVMDNELYLKSKATLSNEERDTLGRKLLKALAKNIDWSFNRLFGTYQGFDIILPAHMSLEKPYIFLKSKFENNYYCQIEWDKTPLGCTRTLDSTLNFEKKLEALKAKQSEAEKGISEAEADLATGNEYVGLLEEAQKRLSEIDTLLEKQAEEAKKKQE